MEFRSSDRASIGDAESRVTELRLVDPQLTVATVSYPEAKYGEIVPRPGHIRTSGPGNYSRVVRTSATTLRQPVVADVEWRDNIAR